MYDIIDTIDDLEQQADDANAEELACSLAVMWAGIEVFHHERARIRNPSRLYLTRSQLLPNPRFCTPWQRLRASRSDRAYITTMGFDIATFDLILASGFAQSWYTTAIPRNDTDPAGSTRPGRRSLDAKGALGLVLHYLNSTMREVSLQQIFALVPSTVSRYIKFSLHLLLKVLRSLPDAAIRWPTNDEFETLNQLIIPRHPRLTGAFASIDGLNLPLQTSLDEDIENATYNGWLSEHFVSSVLVFSPEGTILAANLNAPGSWHDSRVARPIYDKLQTNTPEGYYLVADTAFPHGTQDVAGRIRAPVKVGQILRGTHQDIEEALEFNRQLLSYRQTAEWGNRGLQGSFGRLRVPLEVNFADCHGDLLETCVRGFCLRSRRVGLNQIRSVYMPNWQRNTEELEPWKNFESMLFSEQRQNDRVTRFYIDAVYDDDM